MDLDINAGGRKVNHRDKAIIGGIVIIEYFVNWYGRVKGNMFLNVFSLVISFIAVLIYTVKSGIYVRNGWAVFGAIGITIIVAYSIYINFCGGTLC